MNWFGIVKVVAVGAYELADEFIRERGRARKRAEDEAATPLPHAQSERIAAISRAAGRCPRCRSVHPSEKPCAGDWEPGDTLIPQAPPTQRSPR